MEDKRTPLYAVTYQNLVDMDISIRLFDSFDNAVSGILQDYRECGEENYDDDILSDCEKSLREHEFWRNTVCEETVRIDEVYAPAK
jgi:hypothetical protein